MKKADNRFAVALIAVALSIMATLILDIAIRFKNLIFPGEFFVENGLRLLTSAVALYAYLILKKAAREPEARQK